MNYLNVRRITSRKGILFLLAALIMLTVSCSDDDENVVALPGIQLKNNTSFGQILTDSKGMSLYFFANDADGNSSCNGPCASTWPPFLLEDTAIPAALSPADFGEITRADGKKQTTYKGWPLYYFSSDAKEGDILGDGVGGNWFIAKPDYTLMLAKINTQLVFVGSRGKTVYTFDNDTENVSNCNGGCATTWPPYFYGENIILPSTLNKNNFGTLTRADGTKQNTYLGKALYLFKDDTSRGTASGDGVGGVWHIITKN